MANALHRGWVQSSPHSRPYSRKRTHKVPVALVGVELHGEAPHVTQALGGASLMHNCAEAGGHWGLLANLIEEVSITYVSDVMGDLKVTLQPTRCSATADEGRMSDSSCGYQRLQNRPAQSILQHSRGLVKSQAWQRAGCCSQHTLAPIPLACTTRSGIRSRLNCASFSCKWKSSSSTGPAVARHADKAAKQ